VESKAKPAEVKPATQSVSQGSTQAPTTAAPKESAGSVAPQTHSAPIAPKVGGVVPAMPLQSAGHGRPTPQAAAPNENAAPIVRPTAAASQAALDDATRAATAAVAAAMAKLPPIPGQQTNGTSAIDRVTQKVRELRTTEPVRAPRNPGATGFSGQRGRGGRGGHGGQGHESAKVVLPDTPFDFETANARFNKGDLVKEAIAGSPLESTTNGVQSPLEQELAVPKTASYNKASSFFDDLSSESKDRTEASERPGGRNWRGEEQKKNVETFGQGSVDNGYRGYRGRGRGRGGMRGRGSSGYGRGGPRGPRADAQTISQ
jgi:protein LSM14